MTTTTHAQASHDAVLAAHTAPMPPEHLGLHYLKLLASGPLDAPAPPAVPVVLAPDGTLHVVLAQLAWALDDAHPRSDELEAAAQAWAAQLPAHQRALQAHWVRGYPMQAVPCLRWPLLHAFLHTWQPHTPSQPQQLLLATLAHGCGQLPTDALSEAPRGPAVKVDEGIVRQLYQLRHEQGRSRAQAAAQLHIGHSTAKEIEAGRYPFASVLAKNAWSATFGRNKSPG